MNQEYFVRPYQPGDEEKIVELLELVFDGWPHFDLTCTPLDHWKWKYIDNPLKTSTVVVGVSNKKIIGCNHVRYLKIKTGRRISLCTTGMDSAVHPDYRRIGVYTKMSEETDRLIADYKAALSYWATDSPIFIRSGIRKGRHRFPVSSMIRIHDVDLHTARIAGGSWQVQVRRKYGFRFLKALNSIRYIFTRPPISKSDFRIEEIGAFDDRIEVFWDEIKDHYSFIVERDRKYLNWRYCDPQGGDYIIKIAEKDGTILGYIVLRINRQKKEYPQGFIVDLLARQNRLDVADALIRDAIRVFDISSINIAQCWVIANHAYERLLKRHGFLRMGAELYIFLRPLNIGDELNEVRNAPSKRLHFQYGDTDGI